HHNFRFLKNNLRLQGIREVDGILAALGVSSHQFDSPERGFSIRYDADLDMRMDQVGELDAKKVLNTYSEAELRRILGMYGEIQNARSLAAGIVVERLNGPRETVARLREVIRRQVPQGREHKYHAELLQGLGIEVNGEVAPRQDVY